MKPASVITEPRYLKLVTVSSFCPFILICVDATGGVCHQLGLLGTDLLAVRCGGFVLSLSKSLLLNDPRRSVSATVVYLVGYFSSSIVLFCHGFLSCLEMNECDIFSGHF